MNIHLSNSFSTTFPVNIRQKKHVRLSCIPCNILYLNEYIFVRGGGGMKATEQLYGPNTSLIYLSTKRQVPSTLATY